MSNVIYRILGIKGRTTIPFIFRRMLGFKYNDILSFTLDGNTIVVKREKLCTDCKSEKLDEDGINEILDLLSPQEAQYAIKHLSGKLCDGGGCT